MRLYVYYTVAEPELASVTRKVKAMQAGLSAAHAGLRCELLRRPERRPAGVTVMETYVGASLPDDFAGQLEAAAVGLPQPRHVERFELLI